MGVLRRTVGFFKRQLNVRRWVGYDEHKKNIRYLFSQGKILFKTSPLSEDQKETFDQALNRKHLTEEDLKARYQSLKTSFNFFMILTVGIFAYAVYLLFFGTFFGMLLAFAVTAMVGVQAFKYSFWIFQIKHRKLGCTFEEWRSGKIKTTEQDV